MAYYFLFPEKDATLYSHPNRSYMNSGLDEIIEVVKEKGDTNQILYPSRILIKFKSLEIESTIEDIIGKDNFSCSLQLSVTENKNLPSTTNIECYALAESWNEGSGRYSNNPTSSNGCSWLYRDNDTLKTPWKTNEFIDGTTGSILNTIGIEEGGGSWFSGSVSDGFSAEQSYTNVDSLDTDLDVTSLVHKFSASLFDDFGFPDGLVNHGFIVKQPDLIEENTSGSGGDIMYFSTDTHTIFPPKLVFKWDDSTHLYNSIAKQSGELSVNLYQNKKEYNQNDVATFRIHVRDKYPDRSFTTTSNYLNRGYFTSQSYYSVRDANTEEIVIPFDDHNTKISADSTGMFFKLYMKGLQPERYYRLLFKHINEEGTTIYDDNYHFKVIR